ncbi:c-type cytochrome [Thioalkalivibrio paradoxus]|uniref:Cytochrome C n=1 Tax=Thioalkalivibrio paradoxus ARh 1 TaxID=713585 RepID=W0DJZ1_9GAMM|nr:c-type cytochrome [Thioalkalivibrio paradoxus]AHE97303.1 cytochrome C [Thioalkalivibrio paradoxus ARh 1]
MKRSRILAASLAASLATAAFVPQAAADVTRGELLTTSCFSCHSIDGTGNMPGLVGYPRDLMISQMQAFKDGSRPGTIMNRHARGYTDEEIVLMADYFSTIE